MFPHVVEARHVSGHRVWLRFQDGRRGEADLSADLQGPVFEALRDPTYFSAFRLEGHTLAWENGADFAPEFLYEKIGGEAKAVRSASGNE